MRNRAIFIVFSALILSSCSKYSEAITPRPTDIVGKWTLNQVYANDYWGGPLYWHTAKPETKIEFTADNKYYRKYPTDTAYTFIGTYKKMSDSTLQITQSNPVNLSYPTYILNYSLETGGIMNLGNYGFEGIVKEKFKIQN